MLQLVPRMNLQSGLINYDVSQQFSLPFNGRSWSNPSRRCWGDSRNVWLIAALCRFNNLVQMQFLSVLAPFFPLDFFGKTSLSGQSDFAHVCDCEALVLTRWSPVNSWSRVLAFKLTCDASEVRQFSYSIFIWFSCWIGKELWQVECLSIPDSCLCHNYLGRRALMWVESLRAGPLVNAVAQNQFCHLPYLVSSSQPGDEGTSHNSKQTRK